MNNYIQDHHSWSPSMITSELSSHRLQCRRIDFTVLCLIFPRVRFLAHVFIERCNITLSISSYRLLDCKALLNGARLSKWRGRQQRYSFSPLRSNFIPPQTPLTLSTVGGESITVSSSHAASAPLINEREMRLLAPK